MQRLSQLRQTLIETRKKKPLKFSSTLRHCSESSYTVLMGPIFKCVCVSLSLYGVFSKVKVVFNLLTTAAHDEVRLPENA